MTKIALTDRGFCVFDVSSNRHQPDLSDNVGGRTDRLMRYRRNRRLPCVPDPLRCFKRFQRPRDSLKHDRTRADLIRHLDGLGLDRFRLQLFNGTGSPVIRNLSKAEIIRQTQDLIRRNNKGTEITIDAPPDDDHDLVHLSGIGRQAQEAMIENGHDPAVFVKLLPGVYEAWLRLGRPVSAEVRNLIWEDLAAAYLPEQEHHVSLQKLLAGFKNRAKRSKTRPGFEYVTVFSAPGKVAPEGESLIREAEEWLAAKAKPQDRSWSSQADDFDAIEDKGPW